MAAALAFPSAAPSAAPAAAPSAAPAAAPAVALQRADGGFFEYHGLWAPGIRAFRQLGFRTKAWIVSAVLVLPLLALLGWQLKEQYDNAKASRMAATRQHVETAMGALAWAQGQQAAGKLSTAQAQALAQAVVGQMRYEQKEYFWILDAQGKILMHPIKADLVGQGTGAVMDADGVDIVAEVSKAVKRGGAGFIEYRWPRAGASEPAEKITYALNFQPWGWTVMSGVYVDDIRNDIMRSVKVSVAATAAVLLLGGYLFASFYRVMIGGLHQTQQVLKAMTQGDLREPAEPWGRDEAAELMIDLAKLQQALSAMVLRVRSASENIEASASEVASGAQNLSARTESAAASLQQTAASMEQIGSTVQHSTDHTNEAARMARGNAETATAGGQAMIDVIKTMDDIRQSSSRINDIIGTIDGIAFQTNILALNAAVEAARAGEQGRGFAVVAAEVRTLAQRSAAAAREIKALIGSSVGQVESGTETVRRAGKTIEAFVHSSQRMNDLLSQIAGGAHEQAQGIAQIGEAVTELDHSTQQNAALVEQTAAAAASMRDLAHGLVSEVQHYQLA